MPEILKNLCNKGKLMLSYDTPDDFVRCFWQKKPKVYLIWILYRASLATYMVSGLLAICVLPSPGYVWEKNFIYFTYWAYIVQILAYVVGVILAVKRYRQERKDPNAPPLEKMTLGHKILWCLYTISGPSALGVTIMFWVFVYDPDESETIGYTVITHVINTVTILFDFSLAAIPFRLLHIYLPWLFAITYAIFSMIYQFSGGTGNLGQIPIYKILDWRDPKIATATSAVTLGCITVMHCLFCVINMVKHFFKKLRDRGMNPEEEAEGP